MNKAYQRFTCLTNSFWKSIGLKPLLLFYSNKISINKEYLINCINSWPSPSNYTVTGLWLPKVKHVIFAINIHTTSLIRAYLYLYTDLVINSLNSLYELDSSNFMFSKYTVILKIKMYRKRVNKRDNFETATLNDHNILTFDLFHL